MSDVTDALNAAQETSGLAPDPGIPGAVFASASGVADAPAVARAAGTGQRRLARTVDRLAHQILERCAKTEAPCVLLGIPSRGVPLARRLAERVADFDPALALPVGSLDITLYRDDLRLRGVRALDQHRRARRRHHRALRDPGRRRPLLRPHDPRRARRVKDLGRPRSVQLAVLVDRGHRELPIRADYVGKNLPTALDQSVRVRLHETDGEDGVWLDDGRLDDG